jgi:hypothetical protein
MPTGILSDEFILSRRGVDFMVFEWLGAEALAQRAQYAGQDRLAYEATLDVFQRLATQMRERVVRAGCEALGRTRIGFLLFVIRMSGACCLRRKLTRAGRSP